MKKEATEYVLDFHFGSEKLTDLMIAYLKEKIEERTEKERIGN